jgi:hypothetical protein
MDESQFSGVPAEYIEGIWNQIEPLILKPLERLEVLHKVTPVHVKERLLVSDYQCWIAASEPDKIDACFITYIDVFPTGYKEFVIFLVGGKNLVGWSQIAGKTLMQFAKYHDCKTLRGLGRKGWMRAFEAAFPGHKAKPELSFTFEV